MKRNWHNLPRRSWPIADCLAWEELFRSGDILDGHGAGTHWSQTTRKTLEKHYGCWLGWLEHNQRLDHESTPAHRVTPEKIRVYGERLRECVAPCTVNSYLRDLKVVIMAIAPEQNWRWLMDLSNRLKIWARPSRKAELPSASAPELFAAVVQDLSRLKHELDQRPHRLLAYRDSLILGVLMGAPVRLKNLTSIAIGQHLATLGQELHLQFASCETKNRQPLHLVLPLALNSHLDHYQRHIRPRLGSEHLGASLWVSQRGRAMAPNTIYQRVRMKSQALFGVPINPHTYRTIIATFLADCSPEDALRARPLLGHRRMDTTETYYVRALQIEANRAVSEALIQIAKG